MFFDRKLRNFLVDSIRRDKLRHHDGDVKNSCHTFEGRNNADEGVHRRNVAGTHARKRDHTEIHVFRAFSSRHVLVEGICELPAEQPVEL